MKPNLMQVTELVNLPTKAKEVTAFINVNFIYKITEANMSAHDLPPATHIEFDNKDSMIIKGSFGENVAKFTI